MSAERIAAGAAAVAEACLVVPEGFYTIKEGQALSLFPNTHEVFYNPVQEFNRDLSTLVIHAFHNMLLEKEVEKGSSATANETDHDDGNARKKQKKSSKNETFTYNGLRIIECLSATGLRSIRYFNEIPDVQNIIANDFDIRAVELIKSNVEFNGLSSKTQVIPSHADACLVMLQQAQSENTRPHVIDLDPYGTAAPFLDSAMQCIAPGGLIAVTCTDQAVLCGNHSSVCWSKYGSVPVRSGHRHEQSVRIVLHALEQAAGHHKKYVVPLLCLSIDFYVRLFVRVEVDSIEVKRSASKRSMLYQCSGCHSFELHPMAQCSQSTKTFDEVNSKIKGQGEKYNVADVPVNSSVCQHCNGRIKIGGPLWAPPIHDINFVTRLITLLNSSPKERFGTRERILSFLNHAKDELPDVPLHLDSSEMTAVIRVGTPSLLTLRSAILNAGYRVSGSHCEKTALKTDAPMSFMWDIFRAVAEKEGGFNTSARKHRSPQGSIIILRSNQSTIPVDLSHHPTAIAMGKRTSVPRFPNLPPNWGPMARAKKLAEGSDLTPKEVMIRGRVEKANKMLAMKAQRKINDNERYAKFRKESAERKAKQVQEKQ